MSFRFEIIDEYSHGQWVANDLRFETEAEATQFANLGFAGWFGILNLHVLPSEDAVNARMTGRTLERL